jgi:Tfp pilus assembly protein PilO
MSRLLFDLADLAWIKIVVLGVIFSAGYRFSYYDDGSKLEERLAQSQVRLKESEIQLAKMKAAMVDANKFEQEVKSAIDQFDRITEYMPERMGAADLTTLIGDQAVKAGARVSKTEPRGVGDKTDFFESSKIAFSIDGDFLQITAFLSNLSRVPRLLTFEKIEVQRVTSSDPERPKLQCKGILIGYRYLRKMEGQADVKKP